MYEGIAQKTPAEGKKAQIMEKKDNAKKKNKFRSKSPLKDLKLRRDQADKVQGGMGINTIAPGPEG